MTMSLAMRMGRREVFWAWVLVVVEEQEEEAQVLERGMEDRRSGSREVIGLWI